METVLFILILIVSVLFFYQIKEVPQNSFIQDLISNYQNLDQFSIFEDGNSSMRGVNNYLNSLVKDPAPEEFIKSKFIRYYDHILIFQIDDKEFKIMPLCCDKCKIGALEEIKFHKLYKTIEIKSHYVVNKIPGNINIADHYLVFERDKTKLINELNFNEETISFTSLKNLLKLIYEIYSKYKLMLKLTINNIGVYKNDLVLLDFNTEPYKFEYNIYDTKFSILNKINPDLFGKYKDSYKRICEMIKNNKNFKS